MLKKILAFALVFTSLTACQKEIPSEISEKDLVGTYDGTFYTCGKYVCELVDASFIIEKSGDKFYFRFDTIHDEIIIERSTNSIYSANPDWNASGTSASYGLSGTFDDDKITIILSNKFIDKDIYQNELIGTRRK